MAGRDAFQRLAFERGAFQMAMVEYQSRLVVGTIMFRTMRESVHSGGSMPVPGVFPDEVFNPQLRPSWPAISRFVIPVTANGVLAH